jgi:hypothetical protein
VGDTGNGTYFIYCPLKKAKCPKGAADIKVNPLRAMQAMKKPLSQP